MKLCLVHANVERGAGSARYILDLATRFAEDGHDITLLCHECDPTLDSVARVRVVRIPRPAGRWGTWRLGHVAHLLHLRRALRPLLPSMQFDILLGSDLLFIDPITDFFGARLPLAYTPLSMIAPIEIASYELEWPRSVLGVRLYRRLQRRALERCAVVVRFTRSSVQALERYYGLDLNAKQLVSVYVSREFETGGSNSEVLFERPEPRELLWVGRLVKSKNVAFLIRAVSSLESRNWILNACNDGPERQNLEKLAADIGVADRVRFLGRVDDLAAVYRRASLFLTASVLEQYSLTIMEAYAFGIPCIGLKPDWKTVFNSNEDQIEEGQTGYVVRDERQMAARIDGLLADEPTRQAMARRAHARKQAGFSFDGFYRDLMTRIRSIVRPRG